MISTQGRVSLSLSLCLSLSLPLFHFSLFSLSWLCSPHSQLPYSFRPLASNQHPSTGWCSLSLSLSLSVCLSLSQSLSLSLVLTPGPNSQLPHSFLGHQSMINTLVQSGVPVDLQDGLGWTPLHIAVALGPAPALPALLEAEADVNASGPDG